MVVRANVAATMAIDLQNAISQPSPSDPAEARSAAIASLNAGPAAAAYALIEHKKVSHWTTMPDHAQPCFDTVISTLMQVTIAALNGPVIGMFLTLRSFHLLVRCFLISISLSLLGWVGFRSFWAPI